MNLDSSTFSTARCGLWRNPRLWLCLAPVVFCLLGLALSRCFMGIRLTEIPGEVDGVSVFFRTFENPIADWLFHVHWTALIGGTLVWIAVFSGAILSLPGGLAAVVALSLTIAHVSGTTHWLTNIKFIEDGNRFWFDLLLFVLSSALFLFTLRKYADEEP